MPDGMMMGGPMMVMMFITLLLVLVALIAGVVWLVRTLAREGGGSRPRSAVEQLDVRYARGEIDRDDYIRRRDDLVRG